MLLVHNLVQLEQQRAMYAAPASVKVLSKFSMFPMLCVAFKHAKGYAHVCVQYIFIVLNFCQM